MAVLDIARRPNALCGLVGQLASEAPRLAAVRLLASPMVPHAAELVDVVALLSLAELHRDR